MRIIDSSAELIQQNDVYKHIEFCGRTCYKSLDKITENSAVPFVQRMIDSNHTAMLEHGTVYLTIIIGSPIDDAEYIFKRGIINFFIKNPYSIVKEGTITEQINSEVSGVVLPINVKFEAYYITTNLRVIIENEDTFIKNISKKGIEKVILKDEITKFMCLPSENHEKRYTMRFITDRGVANELVRHRKFSFAQESTRQWRH